MSRFPSNVVCCQKQPWDYCRVQIKRLFIAAYSYCGNINTLFHQVTFLTQVQYILKNVQFLVKVQETLFTDHRSENIYSLIENTYLVKETCQDYKQKKDRNTSMLECLCTVVEKYLGTLTT